MKICMNQINFLQIQTMLRKLKILLLRQILQIQALFFHSNEEINYMIDNVQQLCIIFKHKTMSSSAKCEHGEKITSFCATECCVWKEAGGCATCMKKYHNHMGPTLFLTEEETHQLFKRYNVDPSVKPKCRPLQEAIFNYFHHVKAEFNGLLDSACSEIINSIGHPYLTVNHMLTTFKRIKKKDYKKIQQRDFRHFYEMTHNLRDQQLLEQEKSIYIQKVKEKMKFINAIEKLMKDLEKIDKENGSGTMTHDSSVNNKINEITKNIFTLNHSTGSSPEGSPYSPTIHDHNNQNLGTTAPFRLTDRLQKVQVQKREANLGEKLKQKKSAEKNQQNGDDHGDHHALRKKRESFLEKQRQKLREKEQQLKNKKQAELGEKKNNKESSQKEKQKQRFRINSLDKQFTKTNKLGQKFENNTSLANQKLREDKQANFDEKKEQVSPKRKAFNSKQIQIHEKKQKLIDMLKQREDANSGNAYMSSPTRKITHPTPSSGTTTTNNPKQMFLKITQVNDHSDQKLQSHGSGQSFDLSKQDSQNKLHLFAHTALPRSESRQKIYQQAEQVAQKTIIIPINPVEGSKGQESPLMKSRLQSKQLKKDNILEALQEKEREKEKQKQKEKEKEKEKEQKQKILKEKQRQKQKERFITNQHRSRSSSNAEEIELTDKQQKSIALLIKSFSLKTPQEAIPLLIKSLQFAEDNLSAAEYLSYLFLEIGRPKDSLDVCNKMLEKISSSSSSELSWHLNLIINKSASLNKLGRYSESIVILEECLKHKQHEKLFKNLGDAYFSIGIYEKANYYYEKAVSIDDNYDEAHYNLAVCLFMQENYHNAKFAILKALQQSMKNEIYLELQKQINLRIKDF